MNTFAIISLVVYIVSIFSMRHMYKTAYYYDFLTEKDLKFDIIWFIPIVNTVLTFWCIWYIFENFHDDTIFDDNDDQQNEETIPGRP